MDAWGALGGITDLTQSNALSRDDGSFRKKREVMVSFFDHLYEPFNKSTAIKTPKIFFESFPKSFH